MFSYSVSTHRLQNPKSKLVGFAEVIVDETMVVGGFKIFNGAKGLFVAAPSHPTGKKDEKTGRDQYWDDVRFIDAKESEDAFQTPFQKELYDAILAEFNKSAGATQESQTKQPTSGPKKPEAPWW